MNLSEILSALKIPASGEVFSPAWNESEACYPYPYPPFLEPADFLAARKECGMDAGIDAALLRTAAKIRGDAAWSHFIWHCSRLLWSRPDYYQFGNWPKLTEALGDDWGVFYLLIALDSVKRVIEFHRARGLPREVTDGILADYAIGVRRFARFHGGRVGVPYTHIGWYRNHPGGGLYRLGRLQYVANACRYGIRVFRHAASGQVLMLSEPDIRYTGDGFVDCLAGRQDQQHGWTSTLEFDGQHLIGNPILPAGRAVSRKIKVPVRSWKDAAKRDDPLLAMHIPEGGGMGLDKCRASLEDALSFYPKYLPEQPFKGFMCASWIFNPEFEDFYSKEANIVLFQHELYLFPTWSSGTDGEYFIFDREPIGDLKTLPRDTSIRKAMAEHLERGGVLRSGGMIFLKEDMPRFGTEFYRRQGWVKALVENDAAELRRSDLALA